MTDYLDTSVIVSALTLEDSSFRVVEWITARADPLAISVWTETELAAALSIKIRTAAIRPEQREPIMREWRELLNRSVFVESVESAHFALAARFAERHELGLRSGDALHLAIAYTGGHRIVTLDRRMAEAAPQLGIEALMP